ncbi:hypothetical protein RRG08_030173 [Elysia crispata]|uniref:Uncharacterized protein n=1 Tax=Elysia crispata TaxID=231223 RepID=A0AAE1DKL0_9GAST|nr:hypothetical protein RRG08_030173 [Elysia crispata]
MSGRKRDSARLKARRTTDRNCVIAASQVRAALGHLSILSMGAQRRANLEEIVQIEGVWISHGSVEAKEDGVKQGILPPAPFTLIRFSLDVPVVVELAGNVTVLLGTQSYSKTFFSQTRRGQGEKTQECMGKKKGGAWEGIWGRRRSGCTGLEEFTGCRGLVVHIWTSEMSVEGLRDFQRGTNEIKAQQPRQANVIIYRC